MESKKLAEIHRRQYDYLWKKEAEELNAEIRERYGVDITDKARFDFEHPGFSFKGLFEDCRTLARRTREGSGVATFSQFLRAGINNYANDWARAVPVTYTSVAGMTTSKQSVEPYAPADKISPPRRSQRGQAAQETRISALDIQLLNEKFLGWAEVPSELVEDDQTGQIMQRIQGLAEQCPIVEEAWFWQRFIGTAGSYADDPIPASATAPTGESNWPFSPKFIGGGANRPNDGAGNATAFQAFSSAAIQAGIIGLVQQLDLQGYKLLVQPDTIAYGSSLIFAVDTLLDSKSYASAATLKVGGAGSQDTGVGVTFAQNPLAGLLNKVMSRFLPTKAFAVGEAGKGIVFQRRTANTVIQVNPASYESARFDVLAFRSRGRWTTDWINPRYWWLANDGTV